MIISRVMKTFGNTSRREFLTMLAASGLGLPAFGDIQAFAHGLSPDSILNGDTLDYDNTVLVIVRLFGGNDGLNTVVPYTDENYYKARRDDKYDISIKPEKVLKLKNSSTTGLHYAMQPIHKLYEEGKVLIVQNVGYPGQDLSHFRSNEIWLTASDASVYEQSGWLGRFLEERFPDYPAKLPEAPFAIEMGRSLSRTLAGRKNTTLGMSVNDASFIPGEPTKSTSPYTKAAREADFINQMLLQSNVFLGEISRVWNTVPRNKVEYAAHDWSQQFAKVARLIAGGLKTRLYLLNTALWDFHHNQLIEQEQMLGDLSQAIYSFQRDVEAFGVSKRLVVLTISEFGRRLETTKSGTDHGGASSLMIIGDEVNAGILGSEPDCSTLDAYGNLMWKYDFRQIYASLLAQWLGAKPNEISPVAVPHLVKELPLIKNRGQLKGTLPEVLLSGNKPFALSSPYPNPASNQVSCVVRFPQNSPYLGGSPVLLTVRDMLGGIAYRQTLSTGQPEAEIRIDVSRFTSGRYILQVEQESFKAAQMLNVIR